MELHSLKSAPGARQNRKRVGRGHGSGAGKTSGRGHKGQKSRSGYSSRPGFEGGQMPLHRRLPKRGFNHQDRHPLAAINLDALDGAFEDGAEITVEKIRETGLIKSLRGGVKILARGDIAKRFIVKVQAVSVTARQKIEQAGGSVELVRIEKEPVGAVEETGEQVN